MIAAYAGWLLEYDKDILLVTDAPERLGEVLRHFVRLGYDRVTGYLQGALHAWETCGKKINRIGVMPARQLLDRIDRGHGPHVLDVRKIDEYEAGHLEGAQHIFLGYLPDKLDQVPKDAELVTFCGSGRRASIAASILSKAGYENVSNNLGSRAACVQLGCDLVAGG
jgi:hydroxyacylglutathione hydrolase